MVGVDGGTGSLVPAERRRARRDWIVIGAAAALGALMVLLLNLSQQGLDPDSTLYVGVAENVADGSGITTPFAEFGHEIGGPLVHWPPGYPVVVAAPTALGLPALASARLVATVAFFLTLLLAGLLTRWVAGGVVAPTIAVALIALDVAVVDVQRYPLSETVFFTLVVLTAVLCSRYLATQRPMDIVFTGLCAGAAALTRWAGVALILAVPVAVLARHGRRRWRPAHLGLFALCSAGPLAAWLIRSVALTGTATNRTVVLHPVGLHDFELLVTSISDVLIPPSSPTPLRVAVFLGWLAMAVLVLRNSRREPGAPAEGDRRAAGVRVTLVTFGAAYLVVVLLTATLFDDSTSFEARYMAPFLVLATILLVSSAAVTLRSRSRTAPFVTRIGHPAALAVLSLALLGRGLFWLGVEDKDRGLLAPSWEHSATMAGLAAVPAGVPIYTNGADAVYAVLGRSATYVPFRLDPVAGGANPDYADEVASLGRTLAADGGLVVYFDAIGREYLVTRQQLERMLPLAVVTDPPDGVVLALRRP